MQITDYVSILVSISTLATIWYKLGKIESKLFETICPKVEELESRIDKCECRVTKVVTFLKDKFAEARDILV